MFCVKCGVRLADNQKICPLCNTAVYHPDVKQAPASPLYPQGKLPRPKGKSKAWGVVGLLLFLIPMLVSLLCDWQTDHSLTWFGYVAGALLVGYVAVGLPMWFQRPNPVIFVPCTTAAALAYLLYICIATQGDWFLPFAFPMAGSVGLLLSAVVVLLHCLKGGRLFIWGGANIALGGLMLLLEFLLGVAFGIPFVGWSVYPLAALALLGGLLIFLGANATARDAMERKLFF